MERLKTRVHIVVRGEGAEQLAFVGRTCTVRVAVEKLTDAQGAFDYAAGVVARKDVNGGSTGEGEIVDSLGEAANGVGVASPAPHGATVGHGVEPLDHVRGVYVVERLQEVSERIESVLVERDERLGRAGRGGGGWGRPRATRERAPRAGVSPYRHSPRLASPNR